MANVGCTPSKSSNNYNKFRRWIDSVEKNINKLNGIKEITLWDKLKAIGKKRGKIK